jgi:hypothetical protein
MYGPEKPKADPKSRKSAKAHARQPKKKPQITQTTRAIAPAASTGFPVQTPNNRSSSSYGSRFNESTAR